MSITSIVNRDRSLVASRHFDSGINLRLHARDKDIDASGITVSPEDFAREVNAAGIPGLTVTYEKPAPPLPTEEGLYVPVGPGKLSEKAVLRLQVGGWSEGGLGVSQSRLEHLRYMGGLVRLIPENETDV